DSQEQEDELLALQSIFGPEEFCRKEPNGGGEIRVHAELPAGFSVAIKEGEILSQYEISFLPPLLLNFDLPEDYPSSAPPSFTLTCSWLSHTQVQNLVGEELFARYDRLLLQNSLERMPGVCPRQHLWDPRRFPQLCCQAFGVGCFSFCVFFLLLDVVYCPRRDCGSAVIREESSKAAMCPACGFAFCVACRKTYHGADECVSEGLVDLWKDYVSGGKERKRLLESRYGRSVLTLTLESLLSEGWTAVNTKPCPNCFAKIEKNGGCNVMHCSRCHEVFCWVCLAKL
ncbi:unnamed protein product, partial [Tetraodon nigroviridis]